MFNDLSVLQILIDNPNRLPRPPTPTVGNGFLMTIGSSSYLRIRGPSIAEKQRRLSIAVLLNRLDKCLTLFLHSFTMMHGLNKPTARQHVHKRPSITPILQVHFVCAQMHFFLKYTTKIHRFDTVSDACLSPDKPSLH